MEKRVIALGADSGYKEQVLVTIKSICRYDKNIKFYLINKDIDNAWFNDVNEKLSKFDSTIVDIKIESSDIENFKTLSHISSATYFRYFIPNKISEEKVLYLDSDLIVRSSLDELFNFDLGDKALAASIDMISEVYDKNTREFNAGVILINNRIWREYDVLKNAMDIHFNRDSELKNADQTVLNILFESNWIELDRKYNYQVGADYIRKIDRINDEYKKIENTVIVHFTTANKPWKHVKLGLKARYNLRNVMSIGELLFGKIKIDYEEEWKELNDFSL